MTTLYDQNGDEVRLGSFLGRGGEGDVHSVRSDKELVAKVFNPRRRTHNKHHKIRAMVRTPPRGAYGRVDGLPVLTWPTGVLYSDPQRRDDATFVGYTMVAIDTKDFIPVFQITTAGRRAALGGTAITWDRLVIVAARLCHLVRTLHRFGYAIGDLNDRNVLVSRRFSPLIMDTDSFQVPKRFGHYPSTVGDQLYWAPELLDVDFSTYRKGRMLGDRFALGTLLFQLFMNGMRPYQARGSRVADLNTLSEKTRAGHFPWSHPEPGVLEPPANAPDFRALPRPMQRFFERCFVQGHAHPRSRPSAAQWTRLLHRMVRNGFTTCEHQPLHVHNRSLDACPWCEDPHNPYAPPKGRPPSRTRSRPSTTARKRKVRRPASKPKAPAVRMVDRLGVRIGWQVAVLVALAMPYLLLRMMPDGMAKTVVTVAIPALVVAGLGAWTGWELVHTPRSHVGLVLAWALVCTVIALGLWWLGHAVWLEVATGVVSLALGVAVIARMDPRGPREWRPDRQGLIAMGAAIVVAFAPVLAIWASAFFSG